MVTGFLGGFHSATSKMLSGPSVGGIQTAIHVDGVDAVIAAFKVLNDRVVAGNRVIAETVAEIASANIKGYAPRSGIPGHSGFLARSVRRTSHAYGLYGWICYVRPDAPYASRIEAGFYRTDSLGRGPYNESPEPFVKPASDETSLEAQAVAEGFLTITVGAF